MSWAPKDDVITEPGFRPVVPLEKERPAALQPHPEWVGHLKRIFNPTLAMNAPRAGAKPPPTQAALRVARAELDAIIGMSFREGSSATADPRSKARLLWEYKQGLLSPREERGEGEGQALAPLHSLVVSHWLHPRTSTALFADLASFFGVPLSSDFIGDPNPEFAKVLARLQDGARPMSVPFGPRRLDFPYVVVVTGAPWSGKTTIVQFMVRVFDVAVIEVMMPDSFSPPLAEAVVVTWQGDRATSTAIAETIARSRGRIGWIITGCFPTSQPQFAALEKAVRDATNEMRASMSFRGSGAVRARPPICGVILATATVNASRFVDPETGRVYRGEFCEVGHADLIGQLPDDFEAAEEKIYERVVEEWPDAVPSRTKSVMAVAVDAQHRGIPCLVVPECETLRDLMDVLDEFTQTLFVDGRLMPFAALTNGSMLAEPRRHRDAVRRWVKCLEAFGKTLAHQSNLVATLAARRSDLVRAARTRFGLCASVPDRRVELCDAFVRRAARSETAIHAEIWRMSMQIRDDNLARIPSVLKTSGLLELQSELVRSSKLVFIALMERLLYVKCFLDAPLSSAVLPTFNLGLVRAGLQTTVSMSLIADPAGEENFDTLLDRMGLRPVGGPRLLFDADRCCQLLAVPSFVGDFDDTVNFADSFCSHLESQLGNEILRAEARTAAHCYKRFVAKCRGQEATIIDAVHELRATLVAEAESRCTREMEGFSARFRGWRAGDSDFPLFRPVVESGLETLRRSLPREVVVQDLVTRSIVAKVASACQLSGLIFSNGQEFVKVVGGTVTPEEGEALELCMRVLECTECFEVAAFLRAFYGDMPEIGDAATVKTPARPSTTRVSQAPSTGTAGRLSPSTRVWPGSGGGGRMAATASGGRPATRRSSSKSLGRAQSSVSLPSPGEKEKAASGMGGALMRLSPMAPAGWETPGRPW